MYFSLLLGIPFYLLRLLCTFRDCFLLFEITFYFSRDEWSVREVQSRNEAHVQKSNHREEFEPRLEREIQIEGGGFVCPHSSPGLRSRHWSPHGRLHGGGVHRTCHPVSRPVRTLYSTFYIIFCNLCFIIGFILFYFIFIPYFILHFSSELWLEEFSWKCNHNWRIICILCVTEKNDYVVQNKNIKLY